MPHPIVVTIEDKETMMEAIKIFPVVRLFNVKTAKAFVTFSLKYYEVVIFL